MEPDAAVEVRIYGQEQTDDYVRRFVRAYKQQIEGDPRGRYVAIRQMVPPGERVLDYGCGWGGFAKMLAERGDRVLGIDLDENEIDICQLVWGDDERLEFRRAEIGELEDQSFGCVVSNEVVEHVHNVGTYLDQINRVLAPGGTLLISLPNVMTPRLMLPVLSPRLGRYLEEISSTTRARYHKAQDHVNAWDPPHFVRLVSTVGFAFAEYRPLEAIALPHGRWWPSYVRFRPLRHLSYSMAFRFTKVADSHVGRFE